MKTQTKAKLTWIFQQAAFSRGSFGLCKEVLLMTSRYLGVINNQLFF